MLSKRTLENYRRRALLARSHADNYDSGEDMAIPKEEVQALINQTLAMTQVLIDIWILRGATKKEKS